MPDTYNSPAKIERDENGRYVVTFPDFGWGATDGATRDEALAEAKDLLRELIAATIREGRNLPDPSRASKRRPLAVPPVQLALDAARYEAWCDAGISGNRLAWLVDFEGGVVMKRRGASGSSNPSMPRFARIRYGYKRETRTSKWTPDIFSFCNS